MIDILNDYMEYLEAEFSKRYKYSENYGKRHFYCENGVAFRVDTIKRFKAVVIEYADNQSQVDINVFPEDGDLFHPEDLTKEEMLKAMIKEISEVDFD